MSPERPTLAVKLAAALAVPVVVLVGLWLFAGVLAPSYTWSLVAAVAWFVVAGFATGKLVKPHRELRFPVRGALFTTVAVVGGFLLYTSTVTTTVEEEIVRGVPAAQAGAASNDTALADAPVEEPVVAGAEGTAAASEPATGSEPTAPAEPDPAAAPEPAAAQEPKQAPEPKPKPKPERAGPVERSAGKVRALGHSAGGRAALVELPGGKRVITLEDFFVDPGPKVEVWLVAGPVNGDGDAQDPIKLGGLKGSRGDQQYTVPEGAKLPKNLSVVIWCVPFTTVLAAADLKAS